MAEQRQDEENVFYGDCKGPNSMYVKLISSDEQKFIIKRKHAMLSGTIRSILEGPAQTDEDGDNVIRFGEIPSRILQKVCLFFTYRNQNNLTHESAAEFEIPPEIIFDLLLASAYLEL